MSDDKQRTVQPSFLLRTVIEPVPGARHERHGRTSRHEQRCRILAYLQARTHISKQWEVIKHPLNLFPPFLELGLYPFSPPFGGLTVTSYQHPIALTRHLLDGRLHRLAGVRPRGGLFPLGQLLGSTLHRLGHVLIALVDNLLHPRLSLHDLLHQLLVAVEHEHKVGSELKRLVVAV